MIYFVEDDASIRELVLYTLNNAGFQAEGFERPSAFWKAVGQMRPTLILLDIMLPVLDGWTVCRRIRKQSNVPILMLTARADEDDSLLGYELGADDYLIKPYNPRILAAKVRRFLQRLSQPEAEVLEAGGITLTPSSRTAAVDGTPVDLTYMEFELLSYLMRNPNRVISRDELISQVWGYDFVGNDKTVNSHIRNLRAKLGVRAASIVTVIRSGYKFEVQP